MPDAISNTSPLIYLYRIGVLEWLSELFDEVWIPTAVMEELEEGHQKGYDVPNPNKYSWMKNEDPHAMPSEWLVLDLGPGELASMALALEKPSHIILLDDMLARRTALAAGLTVWGTLRVLLEAKENGLTDQIEPLGDRLGNTGIWLSAEIRQRMMHLAGENTSK